MVLQWWKQGLGFILSLVATPNNINIIESHDISHKTCKGDAPGGHSFVIKRGRELCRATKAHLRVRSSRLWISQCDHSHPKRVSQSPQYISRIVKDKHQEALKSSIHAQKRKLLIKIFF